MANTVTRPRAPLARHCADIPSPTLWVQEALHPTSSAAWRRAGGCCCQGTMWPKEGDPRLQAQNGGRAHPCKPHPRPTQGQWWGGAHVLPTSQRRKSVSSSAFPEAGKLLDCTLCWVKFTLHFPCLLTMPVAPRTRHQSSPNCKPCAGGPRVVADLLGPDLAPAASPLGLASFPLARLPPCHRLSRMESQGLKRLPTQAVVTPCEEEITIHLLQRPA